jgi:methylglutaconyl-CoA hydratase
MPEAIEIHTDLPILTIRLNRPEAHNALNGALLRELTAAFREVTRRDDVRVVVLTGNGRSFCAGADLEMMKAAANSGPAVNEAEALAILELMQAVDQCPKPVVGRINGTAVGGGIGLVSCCDIAVAADHARFAFTEVRLGIVPAVVSPFVLRKIGASAARELFVTAARFDAHQARRIGLVHHVVPAADLDACVQERVNELLQGAPGAQADTKALIGQVAGHAEESVLREMARLLAQRRASDEGQEGMSAFLEKREPRWQTP